jgi:hypothetical protein
LSAFCRGLGGSQSAFGQAAPFFFAVKSEVLGFVSSNKIDRIFASVTESKNQSFPRDARGLYHFCCRGFGASAQTLFAHAKLSNVDVDNLDCFDHSDRVDNFDCFDHSGRVDHFDRFDRFDCFDCFDRFDYVYPRIGKRTSGCDACKHFGQRSHGCLVERHPGG